MKFKNKYLLLFYLSLFFQFPVHAYAGPGAAIGAIVVAITVILAFIASLIIGTFDYFKKFFTKLNKKNNNNKTDINKKNDTD
tara:strand:+ start:226 stop:471 length:246 start_codon:yes stop_codon:yes gene_type:complete